MNQSSFAREAFAFIAKYIGKKQIFERSFHKILLHVGLQHLVLRKKKMSRRVQLLAGSKLRTNLN